MLRNKLRDKNIRKLTLVGRRSMAVVLPAELVRSLGWRERQKVVITRKGSGLVIKDWKK